MDWDEEDELLYGGATPAPAASTSTSTAKNEQSPMPTAVNPPLSLTENGTAALVKGEDADDMDQGGQSDQDEAPRQQQQNIEQQEEEDDDDDDGEEDMDDAESDDSLEIVMDINPNAPPAAHEYARRSGAVPVRPPPPSQVQQLQQQAQAQAQSRQPSVSLGAVKPETGSPAVSLPNPFLTVPRPAINRPTGQPIPTRSRTPPPNLSSKDALYTPSAPLNENGEAPLDFKPIPQPIIDVDLESIEDKRWRRPGAHLSDYFNYGFDESTWVEWCDRQKRMRDDRDRERENPFHVFANRPLQEAWQGLPMELKGLMMQTIMTSFSGGGPQGMGAGGGMHPGMQGMMGPGMQGMMGPGMQGMQGMQGLGGMNPMSMMQQQQQHNMGMMQGGGGGGGGNTPNPGMMGMMGNNGMGMGNMGGMGQQQQQQQRGMGMNMMAGNGMMQPGASPFANGNGHDDDDEQDDDDQQTAQEGRSNYDDEELDPNERPPSVASVEVTQSNPLKRQAPPTGPSSNGGLSIPLNRGGMRGGGRGFALRGVGGRGGFAAGRGGLVPQHQQQQRAVSPLPDNLPKGPRSMLAGSPPVGPASGRR